MSFRVHDLKQNKVALQTTAEQVEEAYQAFLNYQEDDEKQAQSIPKLKPAPTVSQAQQATAKVANRVRQTFVAQDDNE